jgi:IS4 transposase
MSFLTNNITLSSVTIANLYRSGWQIEAFFKLTKQNLRLNEFLGTSRDAV